MNLDSLRSELGSRVVTVTFTKVNGETRVMECTTNPNLIPIDKHPKGIQEETPQATFRVFDVKANGWRSFQSGSIISIV